MKTVTLSLEQVFFLLDLAEQEVGTMRDAGEETSALSDKLDEIWALTKEEEE